MGLIRHETNQKLLEQEHERDKNGFGNFARNLAPGRTTLRVMPAYSEKGVWFHKVEEHFIQAKQRSIVCCEDQYGRCPICERCAELDAAGDEAGAKQFKPTVKFLVNAIILADPTNKVSAKDGVKVIRIGNTIKKELVALDNDRASGYGNIVAYDNGFNLNIDRTGSGLKTEYSVRVIPTRVDIEKQLTEEGIDITSFQLNNLEAILVPKTYEETKIEFEGLMSDEPQEAVPVSTPAPRQADVPVGGPMVPAPAAPAPSSMKTFVPPTVKVAGVVIPPPPMLGKKA